MATEAPAGSRRLVVRRLGAADEAETFARDVAAGLTASPKRLAPKYFYDALGSLLFEAICLLPEYYLTRAESEILGRSSDEIVSRLPAPVSVLELGSGSSVKTRYLIEALLRRQESLHYLPLDISPSALERSANELLGSYPGLRVTALAGDYHQALEEVPRVGLAEGAPGGKLVLFLGSTIGNLDPAEQRGLFVDIRRVLARGDALLLGVDLKKPTAELLAAYDDALGVTTAFNLNLLVRINRELGGAFDPTQFAHRSRYNEAAGRMEMHLVSRVAQTVPIAALDLEVVFAAGETIHTENSHKFDLDQVEVLARDTGFALAETWFDGARRFSVNLLVAAGEPSG